MVFFIVFVRIPTSNIMFSAQFEELNSIFYTSSPISCFTEALCKTAVPVGCPVLFFLVQALKEVNVSTIKRWLKQACYLAYSLGLIIPLGIILFEECVVRSSLIRISVKFFSHELRQNVSFSSFAADNSVYCIAQQEDVTKEESGGVGPVIEMRLDGTDLSLNTDSYHQRKHGNSASGSYHLAFEFLQSEMLELF